MFDGFATMIKIYLGIIIIIVSIFSITFYKIVTEMTGENEMKEIIKATLPSSLKVDDTNIHKLVIHTKFREIEIEFSSGPQVDSFSIFYTKPSE